MNSKYIKNLIEAWEAYYPGEELVLLTFTPPRVGVFDDVKALEKELHKKGIQKVYSVVHQVSKEKLKDLPRNCWTNVARGDGISSEDIVGYRYLYIDIDVVDLKEADRDSKRNATEEEHREALLLAEQVREFLEKRDFPAPILTDSTNGYHLLYRLDMEMKEEHDQLIKRAVHALSEQMKRDTCKIDTVVTDRGRKIKMPGSRNNENEPDTRVSRIISCPENMQSVTKQQLEALAGLGTKGRPWTGSQKSKGEDKQQELIELVESAGTYYSANGRQPFVDVLLPSGHLATMNISSAVFRNLLRKRLADELDMKMIPGDTWRTLITYLEVLAQSREEDKEIYNRIGKDKEGNIYYDLQTPEYESVKITSEGYEIVSTPGMMFQRNDTDKPQVYPEGDLEFDLEKALEELLNFSSKNQLRLFILWLVTCFFPGQGHPILAITGAHGSGKSTICSMVQELVSPQMIERSSMPRKEDNLIVMLANRAICVFDNCSKISDTASDIWCQCVTGGTYSKRKLYEDMTMVNIPLKGIIVVNGCDNVVEKEDLASRLLHFDIKPLSNDKICTDEDLKKRFLEKKPKILGIIFELVSCVLENMEKESEEDLKINYVVRLTSFQRLATRIAQELWEEGPEYVEELLKQNESSVYMQILESNPVAILVLKFMETRYEWRGSVSDLFELLDQIAYEDMIDRRSREYPKNPSKLSYRLNGLAKVLEWAGISFYIQNVGTHKDICIRNRNLQPKEQRKKARGKVKKI